MKNRIFIYALCAFAMIAIPFGGALANKSDPALPGGERSPDIGLMLGKAEMVDIDGEVADILVADPSIVDVMAIRMDRLYLVGTSLGETNIMALDADGNILKRMNIHVQIDTEKLDKMIKNLYPDEDVTINALTDQVVLTGEVSTPANANRIANIVAQYVAEIQGGNAGSVDEVVTNMMNVRGEQQVMLRVKIVEAQRSTLKDLGIDTSVTDNNGELSGTLTAAAGLGLTAPAQMGVLALNYLNNNFGPMNVNIRALEQEGIVNTLAEPNLTAISGEQAGFLAGGRIPIPSEIGDNGEVGFELQPFGVSLNFRPVVMSRNRINLELSTEISSATFNDNLQLNNGLNVPTFTVRRAQTTVELASGSTLMIAGLLSADTISGLNQLPGVGDVPVIGDLLKSDTFNRDETEVIVMITPFLVEPFSMAHADIAPASSPMPGIPPLPASALDEDAPYHPPALPQREEEHGNNILGQAFSSNLRRIYGSQAPEALLQNNASFGYLID